MGVIIHHDTGIQKLTAKTGNLLELLQDHAYLYVKTNNSCHQNRVEENIILHLTFNIKLLL